MKNQSGLICSSIIVLAVILSAFVFIERANSAMIDESKYLNDLNQFESQWYDINWHYRRLVTINSDVTLPWYQVLIKLDNHNFPSFSLTNPDGSDVRFTTSDGATELPYWIESWDNNGNVAYVWVRVSDVVNGATTIYLYYNNPNSDPLSNGNATFDGFDDVWSQFIGMGLNESVEKQNYLASNRIDSQFVWLYSGSPFISPPGYLNLPQGVGIISNSGYQFKSMGFRANFGSGVGGEGGGFVSGATRTMIGDLFDANRLDLINGSSYEPLIGPTSWHDAFHVYEIRWKDGWSEGRIDHGDSFASSTIQVPSSSLPVYLNNNAFSAATLTIDWVYVRQFHDPEPSAIIGNQQGLVDLGITLTGIPDPIKSGAGLTYQVSVSNNSAIPAPGVVVTDMLPTSVQFSHTTPPDVCSGSINLTCNLGTISANSMANLSIVVVPTTDGTITNTVTVDSPGYELDMSDNEDRIVTLVDSVPPNVNWEKPVKNEQNYIANGGNVTLEASAADQADQVAWVQFMIYDHLEPDTTIRWKNIGGKDYTYPYQAQFDSNILVPNLWYQLYVKTADRAGNESNPVDPVTRIIVMREAMYRINLPLVLRK